MRGAAERAAGRATPKTPEEYFKRIERRMKHLQERIADLPPERTSSHWDRSELAALVWLVARAKEAINDTRGTP